MTEAELERTLITRFRNGDPLAFDVLVQLYTRRAFTLALRYTRRTADAEDMVQEAFLKAYRHFDKFDENCSFSSWFYRILINHCLNYLKRERRRRFLFESWRAGTDADFTQLEERQVQSVETPDQQLQDKEQNQKIWKALNKLPAKQREAIILYDLEGFSQQEVAEILKCPIGSVMSRIFYGRKKLKKLLNRDFPEIERETS